MVASNTSAAARARWDRVPPTEKKPNHTNVSAERSPIVGAELRSALNALHLSANEFARLSGVNNRTVKRWLVETEPDRIPLWVEHMLHDLGMKLSVGRRSGPISPEQIREYGEVEMGLEKLAAKLLEGDLMGASQVASTMEYRLTRMRDDLHAQAVRQMQGAEDKTAESVS